MNGKKLLPVVLLIFVLLLGGAYMLYSRLSADLAPEQLAVHEPQPTEAPAEPAAEADEQTSTEEPADGSEPADESAESSAVEAPDFTVYDRENNPVQLSAYIGKPIVLNFWASWCGPCQMEMPDFHEKYLELGSDVHFLMINMTDGGRETVGSASEFIDSNGYTFPVFFDTTGEAASVYGAYSLPTSFFIDAEGRVIAQATGAIDGDTLQQGIDMIRA